jgi:hypothetical protein
VNRSPSQPFLRQRAGSRAVDAKEESDPAKMISCFLARLANDWYVQATAYGLGDLSSRHALVGHAVIAWPQRHLSQVPACRDERHRADAPRASD